MSFRYSDCYYCGGGVEEALVTREIWWQGKLYLVEEVPVGVCRQCGQKFVHSHVAKVIDQILSGISPPDDFVQVPTYRYPDAEQVA
jgi:YgiT-type zinc finger domain-containing protein